METPKYPEHNDIYPPLVAKADRQGGTITAGSSRLPLWAIIQQVIEEGYPATLESFPQLEDYGLDAEKLGEFLADLLEARGEFAKLLLEIARAEKLEGETIENSVRRDIPRWWEIPDERERVKAQLQTCLEFLEQADSD